MGWRYRWAPCPTAPAPASQAEQVMEQSPSQWQGGEQEQGFLAPPLNFNSIASSSYSEPGGQEEQALSEPGSSTQGSQAEEGPRPAADLVLFRYSHNVVLTCVLLCNFEPSRDSPLTHPSTTPLPKEQESSLVLPEDLKVIVQTMVIRIMVVNDNHPQLAVAASE